MHAQFLPSCSIMSVSVTISLSHCVSHTHKTIVITIIMYTLPPPKKENFFVHFGCRFWKGQFLKADSIASSLDIHCSCQSLTSTECFMSLDFQSAPKGITLWRKSLTSTCAYPFSPGRGGPDTQGALFKLEIILYAKL